jgi:hypothetical protein
MANQSATRRSADSDMTITDMTIPLALEQFPTRHLKTARAYRIHLVFQDLNDQPSAQCCWAVKRHWGWHHVLVRINSSTYQSAHEELGAGRQGQDTNISLSRNFTAIFEDPVRSVQSKISTARDKWRTRFPRYGRCGAFVVAVSNDAHKELIFARAVASARFWTCTMATRPISRANIDRKVG